MSSELLSPADQKALSTPEGVSVQSYPAWTGERLYQVTHGRIRLTLNEGEAVALLSGLIAEMAEHQLHLLTDVDAKLVAMMPDLTATAESGK